MPPGRALALDVGERRVGVALSDEEGWLATPLEVLTRRERERDYRHLVDLAERLGVARVVVGLPRSLDGSIGPQARRVERWAERLRPRLAVPLVYWDERYSTAEARTRLGPDRGRRGEPVDAVAAAIILQDYLDAQR